MKNNGVSQVLHIYILLLLGRGVRCLLFLSASTKSQRNEAWTPFESCSQGMSIFRWLASKVQSLLIRRDSFFNLDLGLYILSYTLHFNLEKDGLPLKDFTEICLLAMVSVQMVGQKSSSSIFKITKQNSVSVSEFHK